METKHDHALIYKQKTANKLYLKISRMYYYQGGLALP